VDKHEEGMAMTVPTARPEREWTTVVAEGRVAATGLTEAESTERLRRDGPCRWLSWPSP
jgi:hypothetical protein